LDTVHLVAGVAVLALNLLAGGWGGAMWLAERPSVAFWYMLRAAQVAVVVQALIGAILLLLGREAVDGLHYVYGVAPLFVSFLAEGARAGVAEREVGDLAFETLPRERQRVIALAIVRREMGIMAVSTLVIFFLALRAAGTSTLF
jgi:ABC-type phosphate transport system auxiliary subunit